MTPYWAVRTPDSDLDAAERKLATWSRAAPFFLLIASMIPYLITDRPTAGDVGRTLAVAAAAAAWVAAFSSALPCSRDLVSRLAWVN
jgi:hypothetical protein